MSVSTAKSCLYSMCAFINHIGTPWIIRLFTKFRNYVE